MSCTGQAGARPPRPRPRCSLTLFDRRRGVSAPTFCTTSFSTHFIRLDSLNVTHSLDPVRPLFRTRSLFSIYYFLRSSLSKNNSNPPARFGCSLFTLGLVFIVSTLSCNNPFPPASKLSDWLAVAYLFFASASVGPTA